MNKWLILFLLFPMMTEAQTVTDDPYLWLEDVTSETALDWVKQQDARSKSEIESRPEFKSIHERLLEIYNSHDRIPYVAKRGDWLYNFWQDEKNPRGVWRRTTMDEYRKADPKWETVLDIDALDKAEDTNWVYKGANCLYPDYNRCLVSLSHGGADAVEIREFDMASKSFVKDGFLLPESKSDADWRDKDTLYIGTDFGPGSMTASGYPRIAKEWKRGTPMAEARLVFEGKESDVSTGVNVAQEPGRKYEVLRRAITFWTAEYSVRVGDKWERLDIPLDARPAMADGWLFVNLRTEWKVGGSTYPAGALIATNLDGFLAGKRDFDAIFEQTPRSALQDFSVTKDMLLLDILDNVRSRIVEVRR
ncbi:MAG TPA: hypothetical protein VLL50_07275, partial [Usitatibacter sp.]|nr:hypothetical protein [Usitatibacter sp.]